MSKRIYEKFRKLCFDARVAETRACRDMGISPSVPKRLQQDGYEPSMDTVKRIAQYFNVKVSSLLNDVEEVQEEGTAINVGNDMDAMFMEISRLYDRMNIKQRNKLLTAAYDIAGEND